MFRAGENYARTDAEKERERFKRFSLKRTTGCNERRTFNNADRPSEIEENRSKMAPGDRGRTAWNRGGISRKKRLVYLVPEFSFDAVDSRANVKGTRASVLEQFADSW